MRYRQAVELVPATPAHVGTIAARMREMDRIECAAMGRTPKQSLRLGLMASLFALTAKVDGRPEAMIGLTPLNMMAGEGAPWMLGTDEVYRHGRALLKIGPRAIATMGDSTPTLANVVAAGNVRAIRVLRAWGFTIGDEARMIGGIPFLDFRRG